MITSLFSFLLPQTPKREGKVIDCLSSNRFSHFDGLSFNSVRMVNQLEILFCCYFNYHSRSITINLMCNRAETLMRHLPFSGEGGLQEIKKIAVRFEEKVYDSATSEVFPWCLGLMILSNKHMHISNIYRCMRACLLACVYCIQHLNHWIVDLIKYLFLRIILFKIGQMVKVLI